MSRRRKQKQSAHQKCIAGNRESTVQLQHTNTTRDENLHTLFGRASAFGESRWKRRWESDGEIIFAHACKTGCEGIVSKLLGSLCKSGRSPHWLKVKNPKAPAVSSLRALDRLASDLLVGLALHDQNQKFHADKQSKAVFELRVGGPPIALLRRSRPKVSCFRLTKVSKLLTRDVRRGGSRRI
jgi:hypothetical protein